MSFVYRTLSGVARSETVVKRSRFICTIKNVDDENDAKLFLDGIRKEFSLANHNCYAYIADEKGLIQKFSDDGEPQGTAGMPILDALKGGKLYKTAAVVTRFFGGILLGTGGLVRAYGGAVSECLEKAKISDIYEAEFFDLALGYDEYPKLMKIIDNENVVAVKSEFGDGVNAKIAVKREYQERFVSALGNALNGKGNFISRRSGYYAF